MSEPLAPAGDPVEADPEATIAENNALEAAIAPPRRRRRVLRALGVVVAALVVVTLTGATGYVAAHHHVHTAAYPLPASTYVTVTSTGPTVPAPRDHSGDLRRFLLKRPGGAEQNWTPRATHGTMSLKQVASYYGDPRDAESYLKREGFITAATVNWIDDAGNQIEIRMVRLGSPSEAWSVYSEDVEYTPTSRDLKGASPSHAWQVPYTDATIFTNGKKNRYGEQLSRGIGVRGDIMFNIWIYQKSPQSMDLIAGLVNQQWLRL